jgi:hypothetical protein
MQWEHRIVLLALAALAGCAAWAEERGPVIHELTVRATEFEFEARDTVPAGLVRVRLENRGTIPHHLQLLRLEDGHTMDEVLEHAERDELVLPGVRFVGGPAVPPANGTSEVLLDLTPGRYLMVCYMPAGKMRHLQLGMVRQLVVTSSPDPSRDEIREDVRVGLDSYSFQLAGEFRAGRRVIRVENLVTEPHEVDILRLLPGKTAEDLQAWLRNDALPQPFEPAGGSMVLDKDEVSYATVDLKVGDYALVCLVPDTQDHRPHAAHGMVRVVRVNP